jgi:hypothetical protein
VVTLYVVFFIEFTKLKISFYGSKKIMSYTMKKAVNEIITVLKKYPEPGKRTGSFWQFMKNQLVQEGEWEKEHLKIIEKEIDTFLSKVDKKSLLQMWEETPAASEINSKKISTKEMKDGIIDEMIGRVMDRMDDNYTNRESLYSPVENYPPTKNEIQNSVEVSESDFIEDEEPDEITDEEINLDDEFFNNDEDEDDEFKYQ